MSYLGEGSAEYENGEVVSRSGSWQAGEDGALPGIIMPADPRPGHAYRQEFYAGEPEDMAEIIGFRDGVTAGGAGYDHVLVVKEWTPLEPEVVGEKFYVAGLGKILEEAVAGSSELVELVEWS